MWNTQKIIYTTVLVSVVVVPLSFLAWARLITTRDKSITQEVFSHIESGERLSVYLEGPHDPPFKPGEWRMIQLTDDYVKDIKDCMKLPWNISSINKDQMYKPASAFVIHAKVTRRDETTLTMSIYSLSPDSLTGGPIIFGNKELYGSRLLTPCLEKLLLKLWIEGVPTSD